MTSSDTRLPDLTADSAPSSTFVSGAFPRRKGLVFSLSALAGFLLTVVWSAKFVDSTIGDTIANGVLGHDAKETPISGIAAGIVFAFVTGLAGTFTACNIAVFGAMAPIMGRDDSTSSRLRATVKPLLWLAAGMTAVSATYGVIVGLVGTSMPQFSTAKNVAGQLSGRSIQSMIVYGIIGLTMVYLGLAALGVVRDPFARIARRRPNAPMVFMGMLIGGFLIGRPFGLFRALFRDAAESGNPLYGAAAFTLQSLGNILIMAVALVLMTLLMGRRVRAWFAADARRTAIVTAAALITAGVFTFLYWDVRLLAGRDILPWYPLAPWV